MKCKICGREISGGKCPVDGYQHIVMLGNEDPAIEMKRADKYRKMIASKITDVSVIGRNGKSDSEKGLVIEDKALYCKIADGTECFETIVWNSQEYNMHPDAEWKKEKLEISYKVCGKETVTKTLIMPIQSGYFWNVGVKMNEDFTLEFYLGKPDKYSVSDKVSIKLEDLELEDL